MKELKIKKQFLFWGLATLVIIFFGAFLFTVSFRKNAHAEVVVRNLKENYVVGEVLNMPRGTGLRKGQKEYAVYNSYLIRPDGVAYSKDSYSLDVVGEYELVLDAISRNERITERKFFKVNNPFYILQGEGSYAKYGELNAQFKKDGQEQGLIAYVSEGGSITFAEPIDVSGEKEIDIITYSLMITDAEVEFLTVTLTDCYDSSVGLEWTFKTAELRTRWHEQAEEYRPWFDGYMNAGPKGVGKVGLRKDVSGSYTIDGTSYRIDANGTGVQPNRVKYNGSYNNCTLSLKFLDNGKIQMYASTPEGQNIPQLVTEINNDKLHSKTFPGFKTGEALLTISPSGLKNGLEFAEIQIGKLMNNTAEYFNEFKGDEVNAYYDEIKPTIELDLDDSDNKIVAGALTNIPKAKAKDASGLKSEIRSEVFANYNSSLQYNVPIKDGKFTVNSLGSYTIVYFVSDIFGNETKKEFVVDAVEKSDKGISISVDEFNDAPVGSEVKLDDYTLNSKSINNDVKISITTPSNQVEEVFDSYLIKEIGEYKVAYEFKNDFYEGKYDYTFNSVVSDKVIFDKSYINVPNYFIEGGTYSFEDISAYKYNNSGKENLLPLGYISYDGGNFESVDKAEFTIKAGVDKAKLRLQVGDSYIESSEVKVVSVKDGNGKLDLGKFFVGDFNGVADTGCVTYSTANNLSASAEFLNPLTSSDFVFEFEIQNNTKIDEFEFVFTDYYNKNNVTKFSLKSVNGEPKAYSLGGVDYLLSKEWVGGKIEIRCENLNSLRLNNASVSLEKPLPKYANLSINVKGISSGFEFKLYTLCNQTFRKIQYDDTAPLLFVESVNPIMDIGSVIYTDTPIVTDILSPNSFKNCTLSVGILNVEGNYEIYKDENGKPFKDLDCRNRHEIVLSKYGTYTITYKYVDGDGNEGSVARTINVIDLIPPTIRFVNQPNGVERVAVNTDVNIPEIVVSDNLTKMEDLKVQIIVMDENSRCVFTAQGKTFKLSKGGFYDVRIRCSDEIGNFSSISYKIFAE